MRYLLFSDLHYRESRIKDCEFVLDQIIKIAEKKKVDGIINGGDTFEDKGMIRTKCLDSYYNKRKKYKKLWVDIVGNHDQDDRSGKVHSMKVFELIPNSKIIDKPFFDYEKKILYVPYMHDIKDFLEEIFKKNTISVGEWVLIGHMPVCGAFMSEHSLDVTGVPLSVCRCFKRVLLGHYHKRHEIENVTYIGSPMQQNFSEMDQDKGVIIFDTEDDSYEYIEIVGTPRHYSAELYWVDGKPKTSIPAVNKNDFLRFDVSGDVERVRCVTLDKLSRLVDCKNIKINKEIDEVHISRLNLTPDEFEDELALIQKYIDFIASDLDSKRLLDIHLGCTEDNKEEVEECLG